MGLAFARAALRAGHKVTLITAPTTRKPASPLKTVEVETAAQMFEAVKKHFKRCDCLIMAAAVSDYTPVKKARTKLRSSRKLLTIKLKPTADILRWAGTHKRKNQLVVGFALEDRKLRERAEMKLKKKNLDMIIANRTGAIGSDESAVQIKTPADKWLRLPLASKTTTAKKIIRLISDLSKSICRDV
jgi:phosphopantothenoylcysteine synthetase/decarboxylase